MNSKALPFLIIAGIILAVAAVWKLSSGDEPTVEPTKKEKPVTAVVENKKETTPEIVIEDYDKPEVKKTFTPEEVAESRAKAAHRMTFGLRYQTADKAIEGLRNLRELGDNESAEQLIDFITAAFPNTSIPKDLLD